MTFPIAHRGLSSKHRENSRAAFAEAVEHAQVCELDIRATSDGIFVCAHDATLDRLYGTTGGGICDLTLHQLSETAPDIPTLESILQEFGKRAAWFLDYKLNDPTVEGEMIRIVGEAGLRCLTRDELASGDLLPPGTFTWESAQLPIIKRLRHLSCELTTDGDKGTCCILVPGKTPERVLLAMLPTLQVRSDSIVLPNRLATEKIISCIHQHNLSVFVYTVNDVDRYSELVIAGADGVFTDVIDEFPHGH